MKTSALLRLGGWALIAAQIGALLNNVLYLMRGDEPPDMFRAVFGILGFNPLWILGLVALYASLARRGGVVGLIGFLALFYSFLGSIAGWTMYLAAAENLTTLDQANQISFNATINGVFGWLYWLGVLLLGYTIFRNGVYPRLAGMLLALIAPLSYFNGVGFITPIFILFTFGVWGWLGWLLVSNSDAVMETP